MPDSTRLDRLTDAREVLTRLLIECEDGSKAAALSRELRALEDEIEKAGGQKAGSALDDLAARRASRQAEAPSSESSPVRK